MVSVHEWWHVIFLLLPLTPPNYWTSWPVSISVLCWPQHSLRATELLVSFLFFWQSTRQDCFPPWTAPLPAKKHQKTFRCFMKWPMYLNFLNYFTSYTQIHAFSSIVLRPVRSILLPQFDGFGNDEIAFFLIFFYLWENRKCEWTVWVCSVHITTMKIFYRVNVVQYFLHRFEAKQFHSLCVEQNDKHKNDNFLRFAANFVPNANQRQFRQYTSKAGRIPFFHWQCMQYVEIA